MIVGITPIFPDDPESIYKFSGTFSQAEMYRQLKLHPLNIILMEYSYKIQLVVILFIRCSG